MTTNQTSETNEEKQKAWTRELLASGFTEEQLVECERKVRELITASLKEEIQIKTAIRNFSQLAERREKGKIYKGQIDQLKRFERPK